MIHVSITRTMRVPLPLQTIVLLALFLCTRVDTPAQSATSTSRSVVDGKATPSNSAASAVSPPGAKASPVKLVKFESAPVIDGRLDDSIWKTAARLTGFYQTQPGDNIAPSHPTEVLIGYDSKHLYIAIHAFDDPGKVRATLAKRDEIFGDDSIRLYLDTFNDQRRAYIIAFNPFGIQADGIKTEGGDGGGGPGEDYSVDVVMESKGVLTEDGYTIEAAIPFKSLRYEAGAGKLWGLHVFRTTKRIDNEQDSWMPISRDKSGLLNQEGHITGLEGISTERTLELIPTVTLSETASRIRTLPQSAIDADPLLADPGRLLNKPAKFDPGLSLKLSITPNITLDFAANPDFAQIEADVPVLTANERFPIFFPEKRPFFLEGADIFQTPLQLVHTRTIVDPDYAMKLTGKAGRNTFGLLGASDNAPGNFTDEEKGDPTLLPDIARFIGKNAYVAVGRFKRDIGTENSIGAIATSYDFIENHNRAAGVDGRFRLDKQTVFAFQVVGTTSRSLFFEPALNNDEYRTGDAFGYYWNLDKTGRNFGFNFQGQGRTRDYRTNVGFVRRTNTNYEGAFFRFSSDPKPGAIIVAKRLIFGADTNFDWGARVQNAGGFINFNVDFTRQTSVSVGYNEFYEQLFEEEFGAQRSATQPGAFFGDNPRRALLGRALSAFINTNTSKRYSANFFIGHRWNIFDFDFGNGPRFPRVSPAALVDPDAPLDPGGGNTLDLGLNAVYKPTASFNASINYTRSRFTRSDTLRVAYLDNIYSFRATYQFTSFTSVRGRLDYDTLSSKMSGQYLFAWTPNPGTSFYVGYNDNLRIGGFNPFTSLHEPGIRRDGRTFFVKTSYLFRRSI